MTHYEETIWVGQVFPGHAHRSRAIYFIPAIFLILASLFAATTARAQVFLNPEQLEPGRTVLDTVVSRDELTSLKISGLPKERRSATLSNQPTRTPRPTSTPPVIPPPASPTSTSLMIFLAAVVMAVILAGIWINRRRAF